MTKLDPNRWFFRSGPQCPEHCFSLGTIAPPCPSCLFYLQSDKRAPPGFGSQAAVVDAILSGPRPLANAENALCAAPAALPRLLVRGADGEAPCAADVVGRVGRAVHRQPLLCRLRACGSLLLFVLVLLRSVSIDTVGASSTQIN